MGEAAVILHYTRTTQTPRILLLLLLLLLPCVAYVYNVILYHIAEAPCRNITVSRGGAAVPQCCQSRSAATVGTGGGIILIFLQRERRAAYRADDDATCWPFVRSPPPADTTVDGGLPEFRQNCQRDDVPARSVAGSLAAERCSPYVKLRSPSKGLKRTRRDTCVPA